MMLNNSSRLCNNVLCVSFIVANSSFGAGFCNYFIKSHAAFVATSEDEILGFLTFCGGNYRTSETLSGLVSIINTL